jgi:hypothetical protein
MSNDSATNLESIKNSTIKIDSIKPVITDNSPISAGYYNVTKTINITFTDANNLNAGIYVNGTLVNSSSGTNSSTLTYALSSEGNYSYIANATDAAGNTNTTVSVSNIVIDKTPPTVTIDAFASNYTNATTLNVTGTFVEANIANITVNGVNATLGAGIYNATITLTLNTNNTITTIATDRAANSAATTRWIIADTTAPTTSATAVISNGSNYTFSTWTNSTYVNVTLTCNDGSGSGCNATQYCNDTANNCTPSTTYTTAVQVSTENTSYIRYRSSDNATNLESIKNQTIMIDTTAPAGVTNLGESLTNQTWIYWNWTNPADADFNHTEVWLDGTFKANVSVNYYNATGLTANTTYQTQTRTVDNIGNVNATWVNDSATTLPLPDTTPPAGVTDLGEAATGYTWIYWNWTNPNDSDFNHTEVWINGTFYANVSKPANYYNATGLNLSTTYQIETRTADHLGNVNATWVNDTFTIPTECPENWTVNYGSCLANDSKLKYYTDANSCGTYGSLPGDNGTYVDCNYCNYSVAITNWTAWQNQGSCLINDSQLQNRSRTEYDANYSTCYAVTNISTDLWNSGNNITYWDYNYTDCSYGAPYWTSVNVFPTSPAAYSPVQSYQFNTTWADNVAISSVLFEHNFTGSVANYSADGNISGAYYYNYGPLAAGTYYWKSWAKDNLDNWNSTPAQEYVVNKTAPVINLTLNGNDSDISAPLNTTVNVSVALVTPPGVGAVDLFEDGVFITSTSTSTVVQTNYTSATIKNWTAIYNATQNYSSSSKMHWLSIFDPNGPLYTDISASPPSSTAFSPAQSYQFNATWTDTTNISNVILEFAGVNYSWQDGQLNRSGDVYSRNFGPMAAINYSYKWYANDTDDNNASTPTATYTIEKAVTALFLTFLPSNPVTYNTNTSIGCSANNSESSPSLTRNGTGVGNPDNATLAAGTYNYTCAASATQNYSIASQTGLLTVSRAPNPVNLSINGSINQNVTEYLGNESTISNTIMATALVGTANLSLNSVDVGSPYAANMSIGSYEFLASTAGDENYTSNSSRYWLFVKPNVIETIFNGTDFSSISNYSSIPNVTLEIASKGKIAFNTAIVINRSIDVDANVNISSNYIFVNSTALPELNISANLYLYNLAFTNPKIMRDGVECPSSICTKLSYATGTLAFNVTGFSAYWAEEGSAGPYCGDGTCNNGETCSSCSVDCGSCPPSGGGGIISCTENWNCTDWTACSNGTQTMTCNDRNKCSTTKNRPSLNQSCISCQEN